MTLDEAIKSLMALQAKLAAYGHAMGLLFYDGATTAPKGTAANRGQTMSILSEEHYKLTTGGETVALLEFLDAHKSELNEKQQRMVFLLIKDIRNMQKIPMDEYVAYQQLLVEADDVCGTARRRRATSPSSSRCSKRSLRPTSASHIIARRKRTPMTTGSASMRMG